MKFIYYLGLTVFIMTLSLASGCTRHNVQYLGNLEHNDRTITVPPGSGGIKGKIKKLLATRGWKLMLRRDSSVMEGRLGEEVKIKARKTSETRYTLYGWSRRYDMCLNGSDAIAYEISIIDNKSGTEILTLDGNGCESVVLKQIEEALDKLGG